MSHFFSTWHILFGSIGFFANLLLFYLAIMKSPILMRSFATFIINFAVFDCLECLLDLYLQIRFIPVPFRASVIYVFNGFCKFTGPSSCIIANSIFVHCIPHSIWSILASFIYRYYILFHKQLTRAFIFKILAIIYIPSFIQGITLWSVFANRNETVEFSKEAFPNYNISQETGVVTGILNLRRTPALYAVAHLCIPIFPAYLSIYILRRSIIKHLLATAKLMSRNIHASHRQMLKCLTVQSMIPLVFMNAIIYYMLAELEIFNNPFFENMIYATVLMFPVLSPLSYLFFVRPYRLTWMRFFRKNNGSISDVRNVEQFCETGRFRSSESRNIYRISPVF